MPSTKDVFWLLWKAVLFWFSAIWPISKFTCLCIWASSMYWFSGSKCLHRICHKVILAAIYATESFKARHLLSFPASCFFFFFHCKCLSLLQHRIRQWIFCTPFSSIDHAASCRCNNGIVSRYHSWCDHDFQTCTPISLRQQMCITWGWCKPSTGGSPSLWGYVVYENGTKDRKNTELQFTKREWLCIEIFVSGNIYI